MVYINIKKKGRKRKKGGLKSFHLPKDIEITKNFEKHGYEIEQTNNLLRYNIRTIETQRPLGYLDKRDNTYTTRIIYNPESIKQIAECLSLRDFCYTNEIEYFESLQNQTLFKRNELKKELERNFEGNKDLDNILEKL